MRAGPHVGALLCVYSALRLNEKSEKTQGDKLGGGGQRRYPRSDQRRKDDVSYTRLSHSPRRAAAERRTRSGHSRCLCCWSLEPGHRSGKMSEKCAARRCPVRQGFPAARVNSAARAGYREELTSQADLLRSGSSTESGGGSCGPRGRAAVHASLPTLSCWPERGIDGRVARKVMLEKNWPIRALVRIAPGLH